MRKEKTLTVLMRSIADLIDGEASINPDFAKKINDLLAETPIKIKDKKSNQITKSKNIDLPDIYFQWENLGELDFKFWLNSLPIEILRALIHAHDFDPARRTIKWKEQSKLTAYITEGIRARLSRGFAFSNSHIGVEESASTDSQVKVT